MWNSLGKWNKIWMQNTIIIISCEHLGPSFHACINGKRDQDINRNKIIIIFCNSVRLLLSNIFQPLFFLFFFVEYKASLHHLACLTWGTTTLISGQCYKTSMKSASLDLPLPTLKAIGTIKENPQFWLKLAQVIPVCHWCLSSQMWTLAHCGHHNQQQNWKSVKQWIIHKIMIQHKGKRNPFEATATTVCFPHQESSCHALPTKNLSLDLVPVLPSTNTLCLLPILIWVNSAMYSQNACVCERERECGWVGGWVCMHLE